MLMSTGREYDRGEVFMMTTMTIAWKDGRGDTTLERAARLARSGGVHLTPQGKTVDVKLPWLGEDAEYYERWCSWYARH
jgi:hypothetical protein